MAYALQRASLQTPVGALMIEGDAHCVISVRLVNCDQEHGFANDGNRLTGDGPVRLAAAQLSEYFAGTRRHFDLPLAPLPSARGMALRASIESIPYGDTMTYGALARLVDSAPRAIGQACRRNPLPIIIPCHRVTSSAGAEYYSAGGGVITKSWLIAHEQRYHPQPEKLS
jgi:methylated-DNA-[protein]-cysteine S-methyltransferase